MERLGRTDYFGSIQADKLWVGDKTVTVKMDRKKARKLAASLRKSVKDKTKVELCVHLPQKTVTTISH